MEKISADYRQNVEDFSKALRVDANFDLIRRRLTVGEDEMTLFYVDGFVKDGVMQRLMQYFIGLPDMGRGEDACRRFADGCVPYVEVERSSDAAFLRMMVLSGATVMFGSSFGDEAIIIDARTYPARETSEPESDRVMQGARDGFVETLIFNTALIRRRVRDESLRMHYVTVGGASKTDVVLCYMEGKADGDYVRELEERLRQIAPTDISLGTQSLTETLIRRRWYNPFPKVRTLERPDAAAAELLEGKVLLLCDTSPQVTVLPTSIFDFMQETDDYYFPPLTGTYLRIVRTVILLLSVVATPLWYLAIEYQTVLPEALRFIIPDEPGALPIILQLFLAEVAIDGLKIASMNTPDILSNSLSIVGALILGDFAVSVGWLCEDVILYMAFVAIANFAQQNHELGYAFKFMRMMILGLVWVLNIYGFIIGLVLFCFFVTRVKTAAGKRRYLYPLIPFNARDFKRLIIRRKKDDFYESDAS